MAEHLSAPSIPVSLDLERHAFLALLRMANTLSEPVDIAGQLVILAQQLSGCEAVAIRLKSGPGFPYAASMGFPERFIALENELCATDEDGHLLRDEHRMPILGCVCGRVLSGQVDRSLPFITDRGSFVTTSVTNLLRSLSGSTAQPLGQTRNRCHTAGYETVALFPIQRDQVTYGLIQCNDSRPDRLSPEGIDLMENLASAAAHLFQLAMT